MKRKIVRHGPSSLTVSLPSKWAQKHNLKSGDELDLIEEGDAIVIHGNGSKKANETIMHLDSPFMKRTLIAPYVQGYDVITYKFDSVEKMSHVEENIDLMYGFEIIKQGEDYITIKNISTINENEFDNMILRMFHICSDMFDLTISLVKNYDANTIKRIQIFEKSMTKIDLFCRRLMNQENFYKKYKGSVYNIVRIIETIADHFVTIANFMKIPKKSQELIANHFQELREGFKMLEKTYFSRKMKHIYEYKNIEEKIWKKVVSDYDDTLSVFWGLKIESLYYYLHNLSEEIVVIVEYV